MATYSKVILSGSSYGKPILVNSTSLMSADNIHLTQSSTSIEDEVWLYATNSASVSVELTILFDYDYPIKVSIPSKSGLSLVVPGLLLTGTGQGGTAINAYASTGSALYISGYVNRIS